MDWQWFISAFGESCDNVWSAVWAAAVCNIPLKEVVVGILLLLWLLSIYCLGMTILYSHNWLEGATSASDDPNSGRLSDISVENQRKKKMMEQQAPPPYSLPPSYSQSMLNMDESSYTN